MIGMRLKFNFFFLMFSTLLALPACKESTLLFPKCSECYTQQPEFDGITLKLTFNHENIRVPLIFYRGPYENGIIEYKDTARFSGQTFTLQTDVNYTIVAKYNKNARTYYVVSGAKLSTHYDESSCSDACYFVTGKTADLRIKF
jgi:hypothetical protein